METYLAPRFTSCEVSPKIGPNSAPELSINMIEVLLTDELKSIEGSWISLLTGSFLEKLVNQI